MVTQKGTIKRRNKRSRDKSNTGIVSSLFSSGFVCGSAVRDLPLPPPYAAKEGSVCTEGKQVIEGDEANE